MLSKIQQKVLMILIIMSIIVICIFESAETSIASVINETETTYNTDSIVKQQFDKYYSEIKEYRSAHNYKTGIEIGQKYLNDIEKSENGKGFYYSELLNAISYLYDESGDYSSAIKFVTESPPNSRTAV